MKERSIFIIVVITFVLLGIGYFVATSVSFSGILPAQASARSIVVDRLFRFMMGIATVVFLLVEGALLYAVVRFRRKPGDDLDAAPIHGIQVIARLAPEADHSVEKRPFNQ